MSKLKVGFIGAGGAAFDLGPSFLENKSCEPISVSSRTIVHAKEFASYLKIDSFYTDYQEMLKNEDVDAVCITTPNYLHAKMAVDCANAGKHVLVEKPLCTTLKEANQMIQAAQKNNIILMPAFCERFNSIFQYIRKAISGELFGKITLIRARKSHLGPYTSWSPKSEEKWFFDPQKAGGGSFSDLGSHVIDYLRFMLDDDVEKIIQANLQTLFHPISYDDNAVVMMKFKSGIIAIIETSWSTPYSDIFEIHGTKGKMIVSRSENNVFKQPDEFANHEIIKKINIEMFKEKSKKKQVDHFIDCALNNQTPIVTGEDGKKALEVIIGTQYREIGLNSIKD